MTFPSHSSPFMPYDASQVEQRTRLAWQEADVYRSLEYVQDEKGRDKPKYYACSMLPYPSGNLHMGHVRNYTINDMLYRYLRMKGYNVLMPMGWDAFGLPAENAAIKNKVSASRWTRSNIASMKKQLDSMGLAIDWSRELAACDPEYYKWNQWLFLKMLERGIAYRKTQLVNWDPIDQTVLANEQVIDGRGWRTGALVEQREIPGYYLKITQYADELHNSLQDLKGWPERVLRMQENWIGRSTGVRFAFSHTIKETPTSAPINDGRLWVFTTRSDTIMGVTFCAVAIEHPLALHAARTNPTVAAFLAQVSKGGNTDAQLALQEKQGVDTGLVVQHPLTKENIPVWVANYVLMSYGDGAVMGVPAHDERDFMFAQQYHLPIRPVIGQDGKSYDLNKWAEWYVDKENTYCVNSGPYNGLKYHEAVAAVTMDLEKQGIGSTYTTWRLRDWGISRQRFWGTPIPLIHCSVCGVVPVPEKDLPVILPEECVPDGTGNPLRNEMSFLNVPCPQCGKAAKRETDTMDTFVDSSWYFMRYCSPDAKEKMVDERVSYWMPMDQYIGGIEHAILHLLYSRFWTRVMRDLGLVNFSEPFTNLLCQGMVLNHIYARTGDNGAPEYFSSHEVDNVLDSKGHIVSALSKKDGEEVKYLGMGAMSKSKNNGIDPQQIIDAYGADTARLYVMFTAPPEHSLEWRDAGVEGAGRFLKRVWNLCQSRVHEVGGVAQYLANSIKINELSEADKEQRRQFHIILQQANYDMQRMQYNTVVSACMKMHNWLEELPVDNLVGKQLCCESMSILLRVLYTIAPHIGYVLWEDLGFAKHFGCSILDAPWPLVDTNALLADKIEIVVQINGKKRATIHVAPDASDNALEQAVRGNPALQQMIQESAILRWVFVKNRLVNIVVKSKTG